MTIATWWRVSLVRMKFAGREITFWVEPATDDTVTVGLDGRRFGVTRELGRRTCARGDATLTMLALTSELVGGLPADEEAKFYLHTIVNRALWQLANQEEAA